MPMDIAPLQPPATVRIALHHYQTGEPIDAGVIMAHPYSAAARAESCAEVEEATAEKGKVAPLAERLERARRRYARLVRGFDFTEHGQPVPCATEAEVLAAFDRHPWLVDQIADGWDEQSRFFVKPSAPSSPTPDTPASSAS